MVLGLVACPSPVDLSDYLVHPSACMDKTQARDTMTGERLMVGDKEYVVTDGTVLEQAAPVDPWVPLKISEREWRRRQSNALLATIAAETRVIHGGDGQHHVIPPGVDRTLFRAEMRKRQKQA